MRHERTRADGRACPTLKKHEVPPHPKHPRLKQHFFSSRNPMYLLAAATNTEGDISGMPSMHPTEHPRTSPPGSWVSEHISLYLSCVHLPEWAVSQAIATGALEARKIMLQRTRRIGQAWAVIYFTNQLLTPCSNYFSGASTLNGTPGGDRWARVLGGQIGWLSEPLHRFEADWSGYRNLKMRTDGKPKKKSPRGKHTTKPTFSPAAATNSRHREETRPTRWPILVCFHKYRVCSWKSASYSSRSQ